MWGLSVGLQPLSDNSFLTHLATGRLILDGSFPRADGYSFSAPGTTWVVQSWLASVSYAGMERALGPEGIQLLVGAMGAALGCVVYALTRPAEQLLSRLLVAGGCMAVGAFAWSERPLMFGLLGLGLVLLSVEGRLHPAWLIPVVWIWANAHGSFPLALVAVGAFALGRRLDGEMPRDELKVLGFVAVGTVAAAFGPLGPRVLLFPVELLGRSDVLVHIQEWQAPGFDDAWTRLFLGLVVFGVLGLVRRPSFRSAIPLVTFVALALLSARNIAPAALVFVPCLAASWAGLGTLRGDMRSRGAVVAVGVAVVFGVLLTSQRLSRPSWDFDEFPVRAIDFALDQGFWADGETRVLTEDYVGNLREGMVGEDAAVFIDDRVDMYPRDVIDDYLVLSGGQKGWDEVLDRYGIDAVVWGQGRPLATLVGDSDDWQVIYQDTQALVACRRGSSACLPAPR